MAERIAPSVPPVGGEVDESFGVDLPAAIEGPQIAIAAGAATILLSRPPLESMAAARPPTWKSESERLALIRGDRARQLLERVSAAGGAPVLASDLRDDGHLVGWLIESGQAVVVPEGATEPARRLVVRYYGTHPGPMAGFGFIQFLLESPRREFLTVSWFVA